MAQQCGGDFETTIQRSQWGMGWGINLGIPDTEASVTPEMLAP